MCGKASDIFDIGLTNPGSNANLALVSVAGACDYTFIHELGITSLSLYTNTECYLRTSIWVIT